jgi:hypothetical protein
MSSVRRLFHRNTGREEVEPSPVKPISVEEAIERQIATLISAWDKASLCARREFLTRIDQRIVNHASDKRRSRVALKQTKGARTRRSVWELIMQDPLSKADRYCKEAARYYELATSNSPGFLRDCYRRVVVQYLFLAEGELQQAERHPHALRDIGLADEPAPFAGGGPAA